MKVKVNSLSCVWLLPTPWTAAYQAPPSMGFSMREYWTGLLLPSPVWMWELDYTESRAPENWCFWAVVLEKALESPLDCKEIQPVNPKGNIHWKYWYWSWSSSILATWCEELTHWKRPWSWERLKAGGEGDNRGRDGWMASLTRWTWVWASLGSWWWTGKAGMLQSWSCKELDTTEELNWIAFISLFPNSLLLIWPMFCDKVPFSIFLCCLTNTRFLVGCMAKCHLKVLYSVFIPLKIAFMEVGFLPCLAGEFHHNFFWLHGLSWSSQFYTLLSVRVGKGFECIWSPVAVQKHLIVVFNLDLIY